MIFIIRAKIGNILQTYLKQKNRIITS